MKKITLYRQYDLHKEVVFGSLNFSWLKEATEIFTIELPWLDNKKNISCIPAGIYKCTPYSSKKYKDVWQILDVPNREAILIHSGNFASEIKLIGSYHKPDTEGCILVGLRMDTRVPMVNESKMAMSYLHEILGNDDFELEIKNSGLVKNTR